MKADEARKISEHNLNGPVIEPLLKIAHYRIKEFADKGKFSVPFPFHGCEFNVTKEAKDAAIQHLRNEGYSAKYHPNPDPGDYRGSSYWEISW